MRQASRFGGVPTANYQLPYSGGVGRLLAALLSPARARAEQMRRAPKRDSAAVPQHVCETRALAFRALHYASRVRQDHSAE